MNIAHPFRIDGRGRVAAADEEAHLRQMIEQLLFTTPGERVNRPDFGTGLLELLFAPNSPELATATEFMIQGALQQVLGDRIQVEEVTVVAQDSRLEITIGYRIRRDQRRAVASFEREL